MVDENNVPLGIARERYLVHKDGDWHHAVHIYVFNGFNPRGLFFYLTFGGCQGAGKGVKLGKEKISIC